MIQLATDPNASRMNSRSPRSDGKEADFAPRNARAGHPWPFLSRSANRPAPQGAQKAATRDSGS